MKKVMALLLIITGFSFIYFNFQEIDNKNDLSSLNNPSLILTQAINKDLIELKRTGQLPLPLWDSLHSIKVNTQMIDNPQLQPQLAIKTTAEGKYSLECTFLNENPNEKNGRYLVKFSICDKNNNQLWEKFRWYNR